jgi:NadR type nicotinamide-nucleotide adenylyltransferase
MVIGKFYPPHPGHHLLVNTAAAQSAKVTVVVMASAAESIPLADRVAWMRQAHADHPNVTVTGIRCDSPVDVTSPAVWAAQVACMRAAVAHADPDPVDAVFSSETYGDELAARMGATHYPVDVDRSAIPLSGTAIRADLPAAWARLHPAVRAGLAARVVVLGSESTGTTTLSRALAGHYRQRGGVWAETQWVPEFGRDYAVEAMERLVQFAAKAGLPEPDMSDVDWQAQAFAEIAQTQTARENAAAAQGSPLLVCDTGAFATSVWERRYLGESSFGSLKAATVDLPRHDVYLLTDHVGVPFEQDGTRDGEHVRADMTAWFIDALTDAGHSWVLLTGTHEERLDLAVRVTDLVLDRRMALADPLG